MMALSIPGISTLYAILKRDIEHTNDVLAQRRALADELRDNCEQWAKLLIETFDRAIELWEIEGKQAAIDALRELIDDFMALDYYSLEDTSPILKYLDDDDRFSPFVYSCKRFYSSALNIKRIVYSELQNHDGEYISIHDVGIHPIVGLYNDEVRSMMRGVANAHNALKTLKPK